jgi:mono/diheme cytochrome c family protein
MYRFSMLGMSGLITVWVAVAAAGAAAQTAGGNAAARTLKNPVAATAASVTAGQQLYQKNCQFCHGPKGMGDGTLAPKGTMPANLTDGEWIHGSTDGEIFTVIAEGVPAAKMPATKARLMPNDIWNLVNFIRSIGPKTAAR